MSTIRLFRERLKREGRFVDFQARVEELRDAVEGGRDTPLSWAHATRAAMGKARIEFGFQGEGEYALSQEFRDTLYMDERQKKQREAAKRYKANVKAKTFEEALERLPHTTDPAKEMDWVGSHPAMMRQPRGEVDEATGRVLIGIKDITSSSVGPAPSKRAVIILQNHVDDPKEFIKVVLSEHKKAQATGDVAEGNEAIDINVEEVRRMLAALKDQSG